MKVSLRNNNKIGFLLLSAVLCFTTLIHSEYSHAAKGGAAKKRKKGRIGMRMSAPSMNDQCFMDYEDDKKQITGGASEKKFQLASTSKLATSYWALKKWGPNYRFTTRFHVFNINGTTADVHIEGGKDPFFGRGMGYFVISEFVSKLGITNVRNLTFDENFKIFLNVMDYQKKITAQDAKTFYKSPQQVKIVLNEFLQGSINKDKYIAISEKSKRINGFSFDRNVRFNVENIDYLNSQQFEKTHDVNVVKNENIYEIKSAPLYRALKEMNLHSHNYIADMIYLAVSGVDLSNPNFDGLLSAASQKFAPFIKSSLDLDASDIAFVNGDGDAKRTASGKVYNMATCRAMLEIIGGLKSLLGKSDMDLEDVMAVSGVEQSTLGMRYVGIPGLVIAKTGTVANAVTLAGQLNTKDGEILFVYMTHTNGMGQSNKARDLIKKQVVGKIREHDGGDPVEYESAGFLPFDRKSILVAVKENMPILNKNKKETEVPVKVAEVTDAVLLPNPEDQVGSGQDQVVGMVIP